MEPLNLALLLAGLVLAVAGYLRARGPWRRYQALRAEDANIARYESWRGGPRPDGRTGASVAMAVLRRQARAGALVMLAGAVLVVLAFFVDLRGA
jgi:hypothetical protein